MTNSGGIGTQTIELSPLDNFMEVNEGGVNAVNWAIFTLVALLMLMVLLKKICSSASPLNPSTVQ